METPLLFRHSLTDTPIEIKIESFRLSQDMVSLYVELLDNGSDETIVLYPAWDYAGRSVEFTQDGTTWRLKACALTCGVWRWTLLDAKTRKRIPTVSFDLTLADGTHRTGTCSQYGVVPTHAWVGDIIDSKCQSITCGSAQAGMSLTIINNDIPISWSCVKAVTGENAWISNWNDKQAPATKTIDESQEATDMTKPLTLKHCFDNVPTELEIKSFYLSQDMSTLFVVPLDSDDNEPDEYRAWDWEQYPVEFTQNSTVWQFESHVLNTGEYKWIWYDPKSRTRNTAVQFKLHTGDGEIRSGVCASYSVESNSVRLFDIVDSDCRSIQCGNGNVGAHLTIFSKNIRMSWKCIRLATGMNGWRSEYAKESPVKVSETVTHEQTNEVALKPIARAGHDNEPEWLEGTVPPFGKSVRWFISTNANDASAGLGFRTSDGSLYATNERKDIIIFDSKEAAEEIAKLYISCFSSNVPCITVRPESDLVTFRYSFALRLSHTADEQYAFLHQDVTPNRHSDITVCDFAHMSLFIDEKSARAAAGVMLNKPKYAYLKSSVYIIRVNVGTKEVELLSR